MDLPMQALSRVKSLVTGSGTSGVYSMGCGSEGSGPMGSGEQAARHSVKNIPVKNRTGWKIVRFFIFLKI